MTIETRLRVRYAETDQMGVVYHANYLVWMEMGRVEYCRAVGVRYRDMEEQDGILLAVATAECRFLCPARYDEEIVVETSIAKAHARLVAFHYRMKRASDGHLLAEGETTHVFVNRALQRRKLPAKFWPAFGIGPTA